MKLQKLKPFSALLILVLFLIISGVSFSSIQSSQVGLDPSITNLLGTELFTNFIGALEILAMLMVSSIIGGIYLAKREGRQKKVREAVETKPRFNLKEKEESTEEGS